MHSSNRLPFRVKSDSEADKTKTLPSDPESPQSHQPSASVQSSTESHMESVYNWVSTIAQDRLRLRLRSRPGTDSIDRTRDSRIDQVYSTVSSLEDTSSEADRSVTIRSSGVEVHAPTTEVVSSVEGGPAQINEGASAQQEATWVTEIVVSDQDGTWAVQGEGSTLDEAKER